MTLNLSDNVIRLAIIINPTTLGFIILEIVYNVKFKLTFLTIIIVSSIGLLN